MIGALDKGELFAKLARQFHQMEHRKRNLRFIAIELLLSNAKMQEHFAQVRKWWKERRADPDHRVDELIEQLIVDLDPGNYQMRADPKHGMVLVNVEAERVQSTRSAERQALNDQMLVTTFPMRCRRILDDRQRLTDEQLEDLWRSWSRIRELAKNGMGLPAGEERLGDEYANAIAGGAAVLLWHDDWCSKASDRAAEVESGLLGVLDDPPARSGLDGDDSVSMWTWECFAADATAVLWTRNPADLKWRRLLGKTVFGPKYSALRALFARCAERRGKLGDDFSRLRRLALEWAYARDCIDTIQSVPREALKLDEQGLERMRQDLAAWCEGRLSAFIGATSTGFPSDWRECDAPAQCGELSSVRRRWLGKPKMDFRVVRSSHEWLPLPDDAQGRAEREEVVQFWQTALRIVTARPRTKIGRHYQQYRNPSTSGVAG
jgi:hypothetical protein